MKAQLEQYNWPGNIDVRFLGTVAYEDLPELYAQVGLMAFPTLADEWGLVTVEALAAGVPVLGSLYAQSVEEMIVDGQNGWTFYPDRSETTYRAIDEALNADTATLNEMRQHGQQAASQINPKSVTRLMMQAIEYVRKS
jgi:glycosyltransferase involved in cell wall biosynthesis